MTGKQKGLGRGLDALIKDGATKREEALEASKAGSTQEVVLTKVVASPWQPRSVFESEALKELVESVKVHGILQPLIVREVGEKLELIAGERRFRAAEAAGLQKVPVRVIEASDGKALELALIENLQREDLNPIEEAEGYALLQKQFGLTQEQVAEQVRKAREEAEASLKLMEERHRRILSEEEAKNGLILEQCLYGLIVDDDQCLKEDLGLSDSIIDVTTPLQCNVETGR